MKKIWITLTLVFVCSIAQAEFNEFNKFAWGDSINYVKRINQNSPELVGTTNNKNITVLTYEGFFKDSIFSMHSKNYKLGYIFTDKKLTSILIKPMAAVINIQGAQAKYKEVCDYFEKNNGHNRKTIGYIHNNKYYDEQQFNKIRLTSQQKLKAYMQSKLKKVIYYVLDNKKTEVCIAFSYDKTYGKNGNLVHFFCVYEHKKR